jgi:hypothetical protein
MGNPVYPLAWGLFDGGEWSADNMAFFTSKAAEKGFHLAGSHPVVAGAAELILIPLTATFYPHHFESHFLGPLPLLAVLLGLGLLISGAVPRITLPGPRTAHRWLVICFLFSWIFWFFTYQSNRMLLPTLGLLLAGGAVAVGLWEARCGRAMRRILRTLIGISMFYAAAFYATTMLIPRPGATAHVDGIATALGFQSRDAYLARSLNYWRSAGWLAGRVRPGERVLLVGEHRTMHFDMDVVASDWFDTPQPLPWIRSTPNNDALLDALLAQGIHYLFFNQAELLLYHDEYFRPRLTAGEYARFQDLLPLPWAPGHHPWLKQIDRRDRPPGEIIVYRIQPDY